MAKVMPGRFTAQTDEPFVVFIIGMRVNRFSLSDDGFRPRWQWGR
jgi:hypothetical protein